MAEGDAEEVVLGALARGLPAALIEARAPFAVRWANVAFVRLLGRDEPVEGLPFLALLGCPDRGLAAMFEGLGASGTSVVVGSGEGPRPREHELILLPAAEEAAVLVLVRDITDREASHRRLEAENLHLALLANVTRELYSLDANRVVDAAVGAACSIVNGPAAIYLVGAPHRRPAVQRSAGPFRRADESPRVRPAADLAVRRQPAARGTRRPPRIGGTLAHRDADPRPPGDRRGRGHPLAPAHARRHAFGHRSRRWPPRHRARARPRVSRRRGRAHAARADPRPDPGRGPDQRRGGAPRADERRRPPAPRARTERPAAVARRAVRPHRLDGPRRTSVGQLRRPARPGA